MNVKGKKEAFVFLFVCLFVLNDQRINIFTVTSTNSKICYKFVKVNLITNYSKLKYRHENCSLKIYDCCDDLLSVIVF